MRRRPPRSTLDRSSAASDGYKRQIEDRTPGAGTSSSDGSIQTITPDAPTGSPLAILKDPRSILSKRSVYFDFDSYVIRDEHKALVEAHGKFLREHPEIKMLIQGNADERGSREYNLALGQKLSLIHL